MALAVSRAVHLNFWKSGPDALWRFGVGLVGFSCFGQSVVCLMRRRSVLMGFCCVDRDLCTWLCGLASLVACLVIAALRNLSSRMFVICLLAAGFCLVIEGLALG